MAQKDTFERILIEFSRILQPLADASEQGLDGIRAFALRAGLDLNRLLKDSAFGDLSNIANSIKTIYGTLRPIAETGEVDASRVVALLAEIPHLIDSVSQMDTFELKDDVPSQFQNIGRILFDYLAIQYLRKYHPGLYCFSLLLGVVDEGRREDQIYPKISYSNIANLFKDVGATARDVYGWGTNEFNSALVLVRLQGLFWFLGIAANLRKVEHGSNVPDIDSEAPLPAPQLQIPILSIDREGGSAEFGVSIVPLRLATGLSPGLGLIPFGTASMSEEIALDDRWRLRIAASAEALIPWGISLKPEAIEITGVSASVAPLKVNLHFSIEREAPREEREIIFGSPEGPRLELGTIGLKLGFDFDREPDIFVEIPVKGLRVVISASEGDGFLQKILPEDGIAAVFDLTIGVSSRQGIYFGGSAGLEVSLPTHISLGPIDFQSLTLSARLTDEGIPITAGASVNAILGPLHVAVENMGIKATFSFPNNNTGNLGPVDLSLGFKPPNGVGLAIDAGVVKGGGYLYFDFDKEEYAGALELTIAEFLTLKAIGLITTRMPDGSKGFSLLVIITAEFGSPIQLSFGFTLSGVGGLLGLNRTMRLEPLVEGVRTGAINSVMFPTNVIENAPRIISDLRAFFPTQEGIFLIGPMAKIGWGTPNLVTLSLGIIIEIPGNIAILGVLKVLLPDKDAKLLVLQVNFLGAIEFDKKRAWFFAAMFESRVLSFTIEGEMGVLVAWGDDANFVVSVGGFHPAFNPPPLPFPEPRRIAITILNKSNAKIRVEGYFAVTSNTVQFGARAELFFGVSAFNIDGHIAFDALFQFSPFYFIIQISASLSVKVFGIGLFSVRMRGSLEGPTPWHVEGTGSISLLFWDIDVDFSHTWGEEADTTLPPIEVMPLLKAEYEKIENWRAEVPAANNLFVSLRKIETTEEFETSVNLATLPAEVTFPDDIKDKIRYDAPQHLLIFKWVMSSEEKAALLKLSTDVSYKNAIEALFQKSQLVVLHPLGTLKISQRAVPLDLTINKVGAKKPSDANYFTLSVDAASSGFGVKGETKEMFAMAQFKDMADSQKLSTPAYEKWKGGLEISATGEQLKTTSAVKRVVRYEQIIIDTNFKRFVKPFFSFFGVLFNLFLKSSAVTKSTLSYKYQKQKMPFENKIKVVPNVYVVAKNTDNSPFNEEAKVFTSYAQAEEFMDKKVKDNPNLRDSLHVIPQVEMKRAA